MFTQSTVLTDLAFVYRDVGVRPYRDSLSRHPFREGRPPQSPSHGPVGETHLSLHRTSILYLPEDQSSFTGTNDQSPDLLFSNLLLPTLPEPHL